MKNRYNVGDILIFKDKNSHNFFKYGEKYKIIDIKKLNNNEYCVYFENSHYGCFLKNINKHFEKPKEFINRKIDSIIHHQYQQN